MNHSSAPPSAPMHSAPATSMSANEALVRGHAQENNAVDHDHPPTLPIALAQRTLRTNAWIQRTGAHAGLHYLIVDPHLRHASVFRTGGQLVGQSAIQSPGMNALQEDTQNNPTWSGKFLVRSSTSRKGGRVLQLDHGDNWRIQRMPAHHQPTHAPAASDTPHHGMQAPADFFDNVLAPCFWGRLGYAFVMPACAPIEAWVNTLQEHQRA